MTLLSTTAVSAERRAQPRIQLPPMYTLVRVRLANETQYRWTGHIHDVSLGGMLFELLPLLSGGEGARESGRRALGRHPR